MIFDTLANLCAYCGISPSMDTAIAYIRGLPLENLPLGDFSVEGTRVYGFYRAFPLKAEAALLFENHRRYIDIQCVLSGCEEILCAQADTLPLATAYDAEKDIAFFKDGPNATRLVLTPGTFAIFFPWDAHKPCCVADACTQSHKLVIKVAMEGSTNECRRD